MNSLADKELSRGQKKGKDSKELGFPRISPPAAYPLSPERFPA